MLFISSRPQCVSIYPHTHVTHTWAMPADLRWTAKLKSCKIPFVHITNPVTQPFGKFAQSTCFVQNFQTIRKSRKSYGRGDFARFEFKMCFGWISYDEITSCILAILSQNWPEIDPMLLACSDFRPCSGTLRNITQIVFTLPYHQMGQFTRRSGLCAKCLFSVPRPRDIFIILFSIDSFLAISCHSHSSPLKRRNQHQKPTIHRPMFHVSRLPTSFHDDVIKWKHFPRYWPFVRGIHRSPMNSPHKGQWRGAFMFSLISARINGWVNNREAGDLRRHHAHHDVIVMTGLWIHIPRLPISFRVILLKLGYQGISKVTLTDMLKIYN